MLPDRREWLWGKLDLLLVDKTRFIKPLIQFSADGWGCVPSLYFGLRPNYSRGNGGNVDLLQKDLGQQATALRTVVVSALDLLDHRKSKRKSKKTTSISVSLTTTRL